MNLNQNNFVFSIISLLVYIFIFSIQINHVYSIFTITQVNYLEPEFIQIYSDKKINLNTSFFYDSSGSNKSEKLYLLKNQNNSKNYIIISNRFSNYFNITKINASIYTNKKNNLGYYGLKNSGENIFIKNIAPINIKSNNNINKTNNLKLNLSLILNKSFSFNINYSLHQNLSSNSFKIAKITIPYKNNNIKFKNNLTYTNVSKKNNTSNINTSFNQNNSVRNNQTNFYFNISTKSNIYFKNNIINYEFKTNIKNITIEYWIEDDQKNIIKKKRNTTKLTSKQLTIKKEYPFKFIIKANIYKNSKIFLSNITKQLFYYTKINISNSINKYSHQNNLNDLNNLNQNFDNINISSYIKILNLNQFYNKTNNYLYFEIYRNSTQKRTINFYLNSKKISTIELEKNSKIKYKLPSYTLNINISQNSSNNYLKITGLDKSLKFNLNYLNNISNNKYNLNLNQEQIKNNTKLKQFFLIQNFTFNKPNLNFTIDSNIQNLTYVCYVLNKKKKVSALFSGYSSNILIKNSFKINQTKINQYKYKNTSKLELKFLCKYKKLQNKNYLYTSRLFNITLNSYNISNLNAIKNNDNNNNNNFSSNNLNLSILTKINLSKSKNDLLFNSIISENRPIQKTNIINSSLKNKLIYKSKSQKYKENSYFFVFIGSIMLLIPMIIIW